MLRMSGTAAVCALAAVVAVGLVPDVATAKAPAAATADGDGLLGRTTAPVLPVTGIGTSDVLPQSQLERLARVGGSASRLGGSDRYATAVAVSRSMAPTGSAEVVLATGEAFGDAITAGPLAHRLSGVLLITASTRLPAVVRSELERLKPARITIIGGTGAVSGAVEADARAASGGAGVVVRRLAGSDRYATARLVSRQFPSGVGGVVLVTGTDFPDGLSCVPMAAVMGGPVLLTTPAALSTATRTELVRLAPRRLVIGGGSDVVSGRVESAAEGATGRTAERAAGADRYATSAAVARLFARTTTPRGAFVATGLDFPDAEVAGVAAAALPAPVLLTSTRKGAAGAVSAEVARLRGVEPWVQLALDALARQQALGDYHTAYDAAYQAASTGALYGWSDPAVAQQLTRMRAQRKADGGYGLDIAWDFRGDGTVNPAGTSYLITVTDHVGRPLLAGRAAGAVADTEVRALVDLLLRWPTVRGDAGCLAYSTRPSDAAYCVYNVNMSAAWFLRAAYDAGIRRSGQLALADRLYAHDAALQRGAWWPYSSATPGTRQDWNHNAAMIDFQRLLAPAAGQASLDLVMPRGWVHPDAPRFDDAMGYTRLVPFACGYRSPELLAADRKVMAASRYASDVGQVALWAAVTAQACGP
jgi:putative cell wall-binding protein